MFSKGLIISALLALAYADGHEQATEPAVDEQALKYPEWNALMEKNYPTYSWEAVEVVSKDGSNTKTLFHITGSTINEDFVPRLTPVLVVGDFFMTQNMWLPGDKQIDGLTKNNFAGVFETKLLDMLTAGDRLGALYLETIKADLPDRYARISQYWKQNNSLDIDEILTKAEGEEFKACEKKKVSDAVA